MDYVDHKTLKKGDRILIEAEVVEAENVSGYATWTLGKYDFNLYPCVKVHKVLPRPIKAGDVVKWLNNGNCYTIEGVSSNGDWFATYINMLGEKQSTIVYKQHQGEYRYVEQE